MTWKSLVCRFRRLGFFSEKRPLFIEKSRFKPTEPGLLLYESTERPILLLFSLGFIGSLSVFTYKAVKDWQNNEGNANTIMSIFLSGTFAAIQWRIRKTFKAVHLDVSGKTALVQLYRLGGFSSRGYEIENKYFKGAGLLYPRILKNYKVPVVHYKTEKFRGYFFFKTEFIKELETFRQLILGKEFLVSDEAALNFKVSKKSKNAYKL